MRSLHVRVRKLSKPTLRRLFLFVGLPVASLCLTLILLYVLAPVAHSPSPPTPSTGVVSKARVVVVVNASPPTRLEIGEIKVSSTIKPVGLTSDGDMAIDDSIGDVAWYQLGPRPGEKGNAVIAGHYGWKDGEAAVFNDLHTLQAGSEVSVYDQEGLKVTFVVREIRTYNPEADATEVFRSNDGKAHLNLITCNGSWNNSLQTYSTRLVVFTDLKQK